MLRITIDRDDLDKDCKMALVALCKEWKFSKIESPCGMTFVGDDDRRGKGILLPWIAKFLHQHPGSTKVTWDSLHVDPSTMGECVVFGQKIEEGKK